MKIEIAEKRVIEGYEKGLSVHKLSKKYKVFKTKGKIYAILKKNGIKLLNYSNRKIPIGDFPHIIKRLQNGETQNSIASDYRVSNELIRQFAKKNNIKATCQIRKELMIEKTPLICKMYEDGRTIHYLASFFNFPRSLIGMALRNIKRRKRRTPYKANNWHLVSCPLMTYLIGEKYKKGVSGLRLATEYNVRPEIIYNILRKLKIKTRNSHWNCTNPIIPLTDHLKIINEYLKGQSCRQIAKSYGIVYPSTISVILRKYKVKIRSTINVNTKANTLRIAPLKM